MRSTNQLAQREPSTILHELNSELSSLSFSKPEVRVLSVVFAGRYGKLECVVMGASSLCRWPSAMERLPMHKVDSASLHVRPGSPTRSPRGVFPDWISGVLERWNLEEQDNCSEVRFLHSPVMSRKDGERSDQWTWMPCDPGQFAHFCCACPCCHNILKRRIGGQSIHRSSLKSPSPPVFP